MEYSELDRFTLSCFMFVIIGLMTASFMKVISLAGMGRNDYTEFIKERASVYASMARTADIVSYVLI